MSIARALRRYMIALVCVALLAYLAFECALAALPFPDLARWNRTSPVVLAQDGSILKAYITEDGYWRLRTTPQDVPKQYLDMLLAYEDRRFYGHNGVDPIAIARSLYLLASRGRIVSGASTLTMQAARLLARQEPGWAGKLRQMLLALKLERQLDKQSILSIYLTLAPFGGSVEGVRAASLQYFGIEPARISVAQMALLVALPQSPERRKPQRESTAGREARDKVLRSVAARRVITQQALEDALGEPAATGRGLSFLAHHLSDRLRAENPERQVTTTLIDRSLQAKLESISGDFVGQQPDPANVAIIVIRNRDMAVRAYVGGGDYFDPRRAGMLDLVRAIRSPGSALKPLIYGLAFEDLVVHPETTATDQAIQFEGYAPENFDKKYRGDVLVREALVLSLNTIAVMLLDAVGPDRFVARLRSAGVSIVLPDAQRPPGLALALGGLGIDLENLAMVFSAIANHGRARTPRFLSATPEESGRTLISPEAAWAVLDILADTAAPKGRMGLQSRDGGRRVAYKTGTSYGYKDAWAVGTDTDHVVGVWIGRPDGVGRSSETGASAAAPVLHRIFDLLPVPDRNVAAERPQKSVLARSAELPARLRTFRLPTAGTSAATRPVEIKFPADGSILKLGPVNASHAPISILTGGGRPPIRLYVDGKLLTEQQDEKRTSWIPEGKGQVRIMAVDADGAKAAAEIWLD
jgi:penicillin-binding protein 1C